MKVLWTDGSAHPNPGPGGFAVLEEYAERRTYKPVAWGQEEQSSNIRMEGKALIAAMKYADGEECVINTDSEFWINVLTKWAPAWQQSGWKKKGGEIKNLDLVKEAYKLYMHGNVRLEWTRGHVGTALNEAADEWAKRARRGQIHA
ncbi:ribonuclease HI [Candidatus Saccharibacteria bacterium]|nr:ribonuclease HI [Candidatus Saccharibacteria bacterium]